MTFLEQLQSHKGGLLRLKTELYWYGGRGYDGNPGRVCLILDAATAAEPATATAAVAATASYLATAAHLALAVAVVVAPTAADIATLLLIDGSPHWVWMTKEDVEIL